MKRFALLTIAALLSVIAFAQKQKPVLKAFDRTELRLPQMQVQPTARTLPAPGALKAPRRAASDYVIITEQPEGELKTFHRSGNYLFAQDTQLSIGSQSGNVDIVFGADNAIYIKNPLMGFEADTWVSGTYDATAGKVTIPVPQNLYYVSDYDACIAMVPINNYSTTDFTPQDITFTVSTSGTGEMVLSLDGFTDYSKTLGAGWTDDQTIQVYGEYLTVFTEGAEVAPKVVVAPEDAEFTEYAMSYTDYDGNAASGPAAVAVVGNDVYIRGFSSYLADALIKGTKDGNTVTFPGNQFLGTYGGSYDSYFMPSGNGDAVFTYDPETESYSATGDVFSLLTGNYIDIYATNPVLTKVIEKAAMPANPSITALKNSSVYGWYLLFTVPTVDTEGNGLVTSKLSYQLFSDVEQVVTPLTFTPETHSRLTEEMSIFPYGFTEGYDIYADQFYLNDVYSADWNKIGIKSIYTGGGETNETEIQWYTIKKYALDEAYDKLASEISTVEQLIASASYPAGKDALQTALDVAKVVFENEEATAAELTAAYDELKAAETAFRTLNTAYKALQTEIATAEALVDAEQKPAGLEDFQAAIAAAKAVLDNAASTADELNAAVTTLQAAEEAYVLANRDPNFAEASWVAKNQGYTNSQVIESFTIDENITATIVKGTGTSDPAYYSTGSALRFYGGNTLTITAGDNVAKITKIELITPKTGNYKGTSITSDPTGYVWGTSGVWEGDATEVSFTKGGTSGHTRIEAINIEYIKKPDMNYYILGDFWGWEDGPQLMTQSADDENVYTLVVEATVEAKKYEYKLRQGDNWNGYQLPASGNNDFVFGTDMYPAGDYTLTFTANVAEHTLTLDAVRKINPFETVTITPAEGEVQSLKEFTLRFETSEAINTFWGPDVERPTLTSADNTQVVYGDVMNGFEDGEVVVTLEEEVTASGEYTLTIPAGIIEIGEAQNPAMTFLYAVSGDQTFEIFVKNVPADFGRPYAYAWSGEGDAVQEFSASWPGDRMTMYEIDGDLGYTWQVTAKEAPQFIIFNNGKAEGAVQTADLAFENRKVYDLSELLPAEPEIVKGDVNGDTEVTTSDAVLAVDFALEKSEPTETQFTAADVNKSNDITVSDAVGIVNIALEKTDAVPVDGARQYTGINYLTLSQHTVSLTNTVSFAGFQMDVTLTDGAVLNGVQLSERADGLTVYTNRVGDSTWRVVALSLQGNTISGSEGSLLTLDILGQGNVSVGNIEFADAYARVYALSINGATTGIDSVNGFNTADAVIYSVNGARTSTLQKGVNIIRRTDGQVEKVYRK